MFVCCACANSNKNILIFNKKRIHRHMFVRDLIPPSTASFIQPKHYAVIFQIGTDQFSMTVNDINIIFGFQQFISINAGISFVHNFDECCRENLKWIAESWFVEWKFCYFGIRNDTQRWPLMMCIMLVQYDYIWVGWTLHFRNEFSKYSEKAMTWWNDWQFCFSTCTKYYINSLYSTDR